MKNYPTLTMEIDPINKCYIVLVDGKQYSRHYVQAAANAILDELIEAYLR